MRGFSFIPLWKGSALRLSGNNLVGINMKEIKELEKAERELDQAQKDYNSSVFQEKFDRLPPVVKSMAVGAAVGSMVPIIGTGIGTIIGGVAGLAWKWKNRE
jgi:hypothetical protein